MREIQFRGKRTDNGEWVYGVPVIGITSGVFMVWIESEAKRGRGELSLKDVVRQAEVIPETVGQYTGLKDKNGEEIYEGDIVLCEIYSKEYMGLVEYTNNYGFYYLSGMGRSDTELWGCNEREVIGNIYENPELLEE